MPVILTFVDYYLPGAKAGGALRSVANLVDRLGNELDFRLITRDRDEGDDEPYPSVSAGEWTKRGKAQVLYLPEHQMSLRGLRDVIRKTPHDAIYLNSFFSPRCTILPLLLRRAKAIAAVPTIVAPRGEFSPGALAIKKPKKLAYIAFARLAGLYGDVVWQASSSHEEKDIRRWWGKTARVMVAPDLPSQPAGGLGSPRPAKRAGHLRVVFLSRISRKKNLLGALRALADVRGSVEFDIYGPLEDQAYWQECERAAKDLPATVVVRQMGPVAHEKVGRVMSEHDLFFLPTFGENYGHVILEALTAGCPVLISDRTPWRNLEALGVGWDVPLELPGRFTQILEECAAMDADTHAKLSLRALDYGVQEASGDMALDANRALFERVCGCQLGSSESGK